MSFAREVARRAFERVVCAIDIEQRGALERGRRNRGAGDDHVDRRFEAHEPRETLRAAGAGNQAQLHLREGDLRVGQRHAIVAAQREFESAAHAGAADRGDHRLAGRLDDIHDRGQEGIGVERAAGEFLDVGAAREGALVADDARWRAPWDPRPRGRARARCPRATHATARSAADCSSRATRCPFRLCSGRPSWPDHKHGGERASIRQGPQRPVYSLTRRQAPCRQRQNMLQPNNVQ